MAWQRGKTRTSTWQWKKLRTQALNRDNHQCQQCGQPATEVDHITNHATGGADAIENLTSLCAECHAAKTERERKEAYRRHVSRRRLPKRNPVQHAG
ncbi:HNH endonuclease [Corynebacterium auriscanis]|uniref:HNH endonuclease n=1 Tax=Corynebacterium auriscanis TaxID=99807 RepID=UPI003CEEE077